MTKQLFPALRIFVVLMILTGVIYPLTITAISQVIFPSQANGSLRVVDGQVIGSDLIGQITYALAEDGSIANLDAINGYFWGRPSAVNYMLSDEAGTLIASSGTNAGMTNAALHATVAQRAAALRAAHNVSEDTAVPQDLLFASGSGLDPHISPEAAQFQIARVSAARGLTPERVLELVNQFTEQPQLLILGSPRVNVLLLNLVLDQETAQ